MTEEEFAKIWPSIRGALAKEDLIVIPGETLREIQRQARDDERHSVAMAIDRLANKEQSTTIARVADFVRKLR